ncbi:MAG: methylenetetrahydrofolate reductase [Pseudomonadota bacterium]
MNDMPATELIGATIEVSPKQVIDGKAPAGLFPAGTKVYLTDIGTHGISDLVAATRQLSDAGYDPVPHMPARRIASEFELQRRIGGFTQEGGVTDMLLIAGEAPMQMGPYDSVMTMLNMGHFDHYGVKSMGVAGHPEGNSAYPAGTLEAVLSEKADFAGRTNADMRIVTQFGFDAAATIRWAERLRISGIYLPVHVGVAGPAKITTLLKYAMMCGVGNSIEFLKKRGGALAALATSYSP